MRPELSALASLAVVAAPGIAVAQGPVPVSAPSTVAIHLEFTRGLGAECCPEETELHTEVASRAGYDPFAPDAKGAPEGTLSVRIAGSPQGLTATYNYVDAAGANKWPEPKTYSRAGTSTNVCRRVIEFVAAEFAWELLPPPSPPAVGRPSAPPPPPPAAPLAPASPAPVPPPPAPSGSASPRPRLEVGVGALVAGGTEPAATIGGTVHVGVAAFPLGHDRPWFSFAIEGRIDKPASINIDASRAIHSDLLAGSFVVCAHRDVAVATSGALALIGCALGTAGTVHNSTQSSPGSFNPVYVGAGPRFGLEARIKALAAIRLQVDVLPTLDAARVFTGVQREAWRTSSVSGSGGLMVVTFF